MQRIYLDHSATTPLDQQVLAEMLPYFAEQPGNASSIHTFGQKARAAVETARERLAALISADHKEIVFTSGGTEADNMAMKGVAFSRGVGHIITNKAEHEAVLESCAYLERQGFSVTYLDVDQYGMVHPEQLRRAMRPDTILVSVMHANNEIGTINPIAELASVAHQHRALFHTDAVQTVGHIPVDVNALGVDLLSISAHKFYGPKGVGALYVRSSIDLEIFMHGGGQERQRRSGTLNVPGIVGLGAAAHLASQEMVAEVARLTMLHDQLLKGLLAIPGVYLNGHPTQRLPKNVNVSVEGVEGESLLLMLDMNNIAASSGSACTSGSLAPSHVLVATGARKDLAHSSLRLTLGKANSADDVQYVLEKTRHIIERLRAMDH